MKKAIFYHAGCPVCNEAENKLTGMIDASKHPLEIVHLGESKDRVDEAEQAGVKSVPALVIDGTPLHINYGADLAALKN